MPGGRRGRICAQRGRHGLGGAGGRPALCFRAFGSLEQWRGRRRRRKLSLAQRPGSAGGTASFGPRLPRVGGGRCPCLLPPGRSGARVRRSHSPQWECRVAFGFASKESWRHASPKVGRRRRLHAAAEGTKAQCGPSTGSSEAVTPPLRADPPSSAPGAPPGLRPPRTRIREPQNTRVGETDGIPPAPSRGPAACFYLLLLYVRLLRRRRRRERSRGENPAPTCRAPPPPPRRHRPSRGRSTWPPPASGPPWAGSGWARPPCGPRRPAPRWSPSPPCRTPRARTP